MGFHGKDFSESGASGTRVLLFEASISSAACRSYQAVSRFARTAGWNLLTIEYNIPDERLKNRPLPNPPNIPELIEFWRPKGVIVECAGRAPTLPLGEFGDVPVVLLDCSEDFVSNRVGCVASDNAEISKAAARELLSLGLEHYAFMPYLSPTDWSRRREAEFRRLISLGGRVCRVLDVRGGALADMGQHLRDVSARLKEMPRPCGVFAVNDEMAQLVVTACEMAGLDVPEDVAVLGVDNDERFCENTAVTLSSISVDNAAVGLSAARLLVEMMDSPHRKGALVVSGGARLVRRMSSFRPHVSEFRIRQAMEFIRLNACKGVTPQDVAGVMGYSRRFADSRFVAVLGHSVHEEIRRVRLEQVKLLAADASVALSDIPPQCGYGSMSDLCRDFRKRMGMTLSDWRRAQSRQI